MKILTWNINGIRATKLPLKEVLDGLDADIICLQETKVTRDQLDEPSTIVEGYNSYFSFSKVRSGYSGVATFVKDTCTPVKAEEGLTDIIGSTPEEHAIGCYGDHTDFSNEELQSLDNEGRTVITQHRLKDAEGKCQLLTIINVYCPRADPEREDRKQFKLRFYNLLQARAEALLASGSHVIVLGDVNTSHKRIDHCDPAEEKEFEAHKGRQWLNRFLCDPSQKETPVQKPLDLNTSTSSDSNTGHKFIDTFRHFYPNMPTAYTCWSTVTGARATNYGVRIDYIFADIELTNKAISDCVIRPDIEGSDHCPVKATLSWEVAPSSKCPPLCTKFLPEFSGKQQKLSSFFMKMSPKKSISDVGSNSSSQNSSQESAASESLGEKLFGKRNGEPINQPPLKKVKSDSKKTGAKQGSLLSFFGKGSSSNSTQGTKKPETKSASSVVPDKTSSNIQLERNVSNKDTDKSSQAQSWKSLLKGPPPAPLCKGHKEPCVLRTVKKDSLNKGRQFYVCTRPDGAKNNPEARCDHFEWVERKKKS